MTPKYEQLVQEYHVVPVTDPDFELLAVNRAEGFRAGAQFYALPPLEVGAYTGRRWPYWSRRDSLKSGAAAAAFSARPPRGRTGGSP